MQAGSEWISQDSGAWGLLTLLTSIHCQGAETGWGVSECTLYASYTGRQGPVGQCQTSTQPFSGEEHSTASTGSIACPGEERRRSTGQYHPLPSRPGPPGLDGFLGGTFVASTRGVTGEGSETRHCLSLQVLSRGGRGATKVTSAGGSYMV
ncbi:hypothetical protein B0T25DRAFT_87492 [Lasiosphaeria hispida]|uniref:Uncharacterized protein n=1 Tax=Lasiosphaeria hispida TaxID=260671 RepID=A0AAJ0HQ23_9PEZI|nr:hypothetical protein B0T25DRAFT_87492 [Lasiosphaeria hispida]